MPLFQKSVVAKYLESQSKEILRSRWDFFRSHFLNRAIQENIRGSKEEQYQEGFLSDLFVSALGYVKNPAPDFNLTTEYKNVKDSKKADGAVIIEGKVTAVIELKGTNTTDLGKIETQAFGYKNNQPDCVYVITSNFEKLRFYIDNATEFLEFDLFRLSEKEFELMHLCLAHENIRKDIPRKIKEESISQESVITKRLYKDYSDFKNELYQNLIAHNPEHDPLELFRKSQKLLDRFLFIFFAEDRNLLPTNLIFRINKEWRQLREMRIEVSLYERYKIYFNDLNTGAKVALPAFSETAARQKEEHQIYAYNGGLFKPDEILDSIRIDDEILFRNTEKLSHYDFQSEVDVNILGHIFENSLNEIDEIKARLQGEAIDKSKTKRKKDGVFYTPKYITKYIVDNTVGKLCAEKKTALGIIEEDYTTDRKRQKKTVLAMAAKLSDYRNWLLQVTICDPACGSGAFLNQALEFLIAEHRYIDELQAKLFGDALVLSDIENSILENNLFGVDLNEESVEIARLSLWLRTAQTNRKLNDLNNNIKQGNSLIDDPEVAGNDAFDWKREFPKVFEKGGFDVVIGNPPYVKLETMKELSEKMSKLGYSTFEKRGDLYILFVEKGFQILKETGKIAYIMPNKWLQAGYGKPLREFFLSQNLKRLIDFGDLQIFDGATTYPCIFIAEQSKPSKEILISVLNKNKKLDFEQNVSLNQQVFEHSKFDGNTWIISSNLEQKLLEKLSKKNKTLKEFINDQAYYGVKTGFSDAFFIDSKTCVELVNQHSLAADLLLPFLQGRTLSKWQTPRVDNYLIGTFPAFKLDIENYFSIKTHLLKFGMQRLEQTGAIGSRKKTCNKWFETQDSINYWKEFLKPKIMYQKFQVKPCFIYDESGLYCNDSMWIIPTEDKALVAILNSKMGWWLISKYCTQIQNGYQLIWNYFGLIPIPESISNNSDLAQKADNMISLNKELQDCSQKFQRTILRKFNLTELPKKLQDWYLLSYKDFIAELAKKKVKLSLSEEAEWENYFTSEAKKALALKHDIDATDKAIDKMVYELYGLNEEEIAIVEGN